MTLPIQPDSDPGTPPMPSNEAARLAALQRYEILDTESEPEFDDLARVAALVCDAPIALVSLVDASRQWFKARVGLEASETPRNVAFCAHTILQSEPLVVPDTHADARFHDNPLVCGEPNIRFYAGVPLVTPDNFRLGTLCVIDRRPRQLTALQLDTLRTLAHAVTSHLELRRKLKAVSQQRAQLVIEMKQAELAQAKAITAAEDASRIKSEFLASMSHELRTPLTNILGLSEAMGQGVYGPLNEKQQRSLKYIEDSGRHLLSLFNDILDLSKIEAGRLDIEMQMLEVGDLCRSCLALTEQSAQNKGLRITSSIEPPTLRLHSDARRLKQILFNLLSNAVKFTPPGGTIDLAVRGDARKGTATFTVSDTGIGISPADLAYLCEPFVQLKPLQHAGTGLGLAVVKRLTERLGGSIHIDSELGRGSCFKVVIPWADRHEVNFDAVNAPTEPAPTAAVPTPAAAHHPLMLVADDNEISRRLLTVYFTALGYCVETADDGAEVVERCRTTHPDIIVMDVRMPHIDGLEAIRILRRAADARLAKTPIIALTGLVRPGDREHCLAAGANAYVSKPVRLRELFVLAEGFLQPARALDLD